VRAGAQPTPKTVEFGCGASPQWTAPLGVHAATVDAYGAEGGSALWTTKLQLSENLPGPITETRVSPGGLGGRTLAKVPIDPGALYHVFAGCSGQPNAALCYEKPTYSTWGGAPGGVAGGSTGAGGGGASYMTKAGSNKILAIAGGGGGGAANSGGKSVSSAGAGGAGGGAFQPGKDGKSFGIGGQGGGGGGLVEWGKGGGAIWPYPWNISDPAVGSNGTFFYGGSGGGSITCSPTVGMAGGGGGGGGAIGGGGGGGHVGSGHLDGFVKQYSLAYAGGGGGGSGFSADFDAHGETGVRKGNGLVKITYTVDPHAWIELFNVTSIPVQGKFQFALFKCVDQKERSRAAVVDSGPPGRSCTRVSDAALSDDDGKVFTGLRVGTYVLRQTGAPDGWTLGDIRCVDVPGGAEPSGEIEVGSPVVADGEIVLKFRRRQHVRCTFANRSAFAGLPGPAQTIPSTTTTRPRATTPPPTAPVTTPPTEPPTDPATDPPTTPTTPPCFPGTPGCP